MKKYIIILIAFSLLMPLSAKAKVKRVDSNKQVDLSGNWNDTDIRIVCETLIDECVESRVITNYKKKTGKIPVVKLGTIMNLSDEHIDTTIIANKFRNAIINSGELKFVSSDRVRITLSQLVKSPFSLFNKYEQGKITLGTNPVVS